MTVHINWQSYFKEFSRQHGGSPIVYRVDKETGKGGYLLFRDGWMYSRTDPKGPEYPPLNSDDCLHKMRDYWQIRKAVIAHELQALKQSIVTLARVQDNRSAQLMTVESVIVDLDDGRRVRKNKTVVVDFDLMMSKVEELTRDVEECKTNLAGLVVPEPDPPHYAELLVATQLQLIELKSGVK